MSARHFRTSCAEFSSFSIAEPGKDKQECCRVLNKQKSFLRGLEIPSRLDAQSFGPQPLQRTQKIHKNVSRLTSLKKRNSTAFEHETKGQRKNCIIASLFHLMKHERCGWLWPRQIRRASNGNRVNQQTLVGSEKIELQISVTHKCMHASGK